MKWLIESVSLLISLVNFVGFMCCLRFLVISKSNNHDLTTTLVYSLEIVSLSAVWLLNLQES